MKSQNALLLAVYAMSAYAQLDSKEMNLHLVAGEPILGTISDANSSMTSWMSKFNDSTPLVSMNIPGTHDACAWNYTGDFAEVVNCQDVPLFDQLDAGIRFLDIRFGWDANQTQLSLYHADALLSDTVQLVDVIWGLYHFLDLHPTETIFVSLKVDNGVTDLALQQAVYDMVTTSPTNAYWLQGTELGTLGDARKKLVFFRRFSLNVSMTPVGIDVSSNWKDNDPDFMIEYSSNTSAWIEDYYLFIGDVAPDVKIGQKYDATTDHLANANGSGNSTQFFVSFASASAYATSGLVDLTPKVMADGNGTTQGMNQRLLPYLQQNKGNRLGVVLFDFFETVPELVSAVIGVDYVPSNTTQGVSTTSKAGASAIGTTSSKSASPSSMSVTGPLCYISGLLALFFML